MFAELCGTTWLTFVGLIKAANKAPE